MWKVSESGDDSIFDDRDQRTVKPLDQLWDDRPCN